MIVANNKIVYLDDGGNTVYTLPSTAGNDGDILQIDANSEITFTTGLPYTPAISESWNTSPTTVGAALDELIERLIALEGAGPA